MDEDANLQTARERAVFLVHEKRDRIARAVARQIQHQVPKYKEVDQVALARSCRGVLSASEPLVRAGDARRLAALVDDLATMRLAGGFELEHFVVAALCFVPVLRQFFFETIKDPAEANLLYEQYEGVLLPFVGRVANIFMNSEYDVTNPDGIDTVSLRSALTQLTAERFPRIRPLTVEENTDSGRSSPFSRQG